MPEGHYASKSKVVQFDAQEEEDQLIMRFYADQ